MIRLVRSWAAHLVVGVVVVGIFAKLTDSVREGDSVTRFDTSVTNWVVARRSPSLVSIMEAVTHLGDSWTVVAIVVVASAVLTWRRHRLAAAFVAVSSIGSAALVGIAKVAVGRSRPPLPDAAVSVSGYAFPSGHAAQSIACYGAILVVMWHLTDRRIVRAAAVVCGVALALAVGGSRVVLGVHWCSDVIGGWMVAAGWLLTALRSGQAMRRRRTRFDDLKPAAWDTISVNVVNEAQHRDVWR